jgi:hypothetical protein
MGSPKTYTSQLARGWFSLDQTPKTVSVVFVLERGRGRVVVAQPRGKRRFTAARNLMHELQGCLEVPQP